MNANTPNTGRRKTLQNARERQQRKKPTNSTIASLSIQCQDVAKAICLNKLLSLILAYLMLRHKVLAFRYKKSLNSEGSRYNEV